MRVHAYREVVANRPVRRPLTPSANGASHDTGRGETHGRTRPRAARPDGSCT